MHNFMKVIRSLILLLLLVAQGTLSLAAQNREVTGTVLDTMDEPLAGVTVMEAGTTNGCMTDLDGKFSIKVAADATVTQLLIRGLHTAVGQGGSRRQRPPHSHERRRCDA